MKTNTKFVKIILLLYLSFAAYDYLLREGLKEGVWENILWRDGMPPIKSIAKSLLWPLFLVYSTTTIGGVENNTETDSIIPVTKEINSAQYLGYWCGHKSKELRVICYSYIEGYQQASAVSAKIAKKHFRDDAGLMKKMMFSCSENAYSKELGEKFVRWLLEDKARFRMPMGLAISYMLIEEYPCSK